MHRAACCHVASHRLMLQRLRCSLPALNQQQLSQDPAAGITLQTLSHLWSVRCLTRHMTPVWAGPVNIHDRVQRAMAVPSLNHRDPWFPSFYKKLLEDTKVIFNTDQVPSSLCAQNSHEAYCQG